VLGFGHERRLLSFIDQLHQAFINHLYQSSNCCLLFQQQQHVIGCCYTIALHDQHNSILLFIPSNFQINVLPFSQQAVPCLFQPWWTYVRGHVWSLPFL
jgi:hypothetical protein